MADLLQSSQKTETQAPSYYTNYLNSIASGGQNAAQGAKFVGAQPLQQKAFANVEQNVGNYQPTLNQATGTLGRASTASPLDAANQYLSNANVDQSQLARQYMNPYTQDVVNSIATLGQRNIQQNLAPQATAAAVGSGQFGSKRGAEVLGQTIQNANTDILAQQNQALQTGYQNAMANAQKQQALQAQLAQTAGNLSATEQANLINAATTGGNLAGQTQTLGLGDVNALATLGGQQQTIGQNEQMFPLTALSKQAELMRGLTIPTSTVSTYKGSPLSAAATIGSTVAGLAQPTYTIGPDGKVVAGPSVGGQIVGGITDAAKGAYNYVKDAFNSSPSTPIDFGQGNNVNDTASYYPPNYPSYNNSFVPDPRYNTDSNNPYDY
jgi:hypothetical protein